MISQRSMYLLVFTCIILYGLNATAQNSVSTLGPIDPQSQENLHQMIDIDWRLGPRLPKGLQDSGAGVVANTIVSLGGFNNGSGPGDRGFHNETWGLDLSNLEGGWQSLPNYPGSNTSSNIDGAGRQGINTVVVNDALYAWGGFNYTAPNTYSDGYKLSNTNGNWAWAALPSMPTPRSFSGLISVGSNIYSFGGGDYDGSNFYTETDRTGSIERYGAKVYRFDTQSPTQGWQEMPEMPGTHRWLSATAAIGDKIYVLGGVSNSTAGAYRTVVDNWMLDTTSSTWTRIRDLPVASGNFPTSNQPVIDDRYILLIGGAQYGEIQNPDGTVRPVYGTTSKVYSDNPYNSDIWVYDTWTNLFGTASLLPLNNNVPTVVYEDGVLHLIGGETGGATIFGEDFAHHPDLYLLGDVSVIVPEPVTLVIVLAGIAMTYIRRGPRSFHC